MREKKRVVVAMSGGIDSSVAAALLTKQGLEVIGITMHFDILESSSRLNLHVSNALRVAEKLGIKHYTIDISRDLKEKVIKDLCAEYAKGRTPNPCIRCNKYIKFSALLRKARALEAEYLATGHYARIKKVRSTEYGVPRYLLQKARDQKKDQSYFLYRLNQNQLKHILFPLGNYTKEQVRRLARKFDLPVSYNPESQDICFIPNKDYREFLDKQGIKSRPGYIVDRKGNILGQHRGIAFYTIGQRQGLGIAAAHPLHIKEINAKANTIVVAGKEDVFASGLLIKKVNFISKPIKKKIALRVRIRYNHKEMPAGISPLGNNKLKAHFRRPQFAITPGQSAVFYDKDTVIGGGIIDKVLS
ncbi:MAG: tRNA 2-thiouridine(34) synthase MnmA [Candidatus Omnitrophota bacterium]|nr:MAG: tRNA 2-thiouridine(34) synthase MnmA [Candidatus Omnitrophota bacterium]